MTLKEYYEDHYLPLHKNRFNRALHFTGQLWTIIFIMICVSTSNFWMLLFAPLVVYPFAWFGHFALEKNKPAAFSNPLYAEASD